MSDQRVGASPARVGGRDRVTGRQAYVADIPLEDVLHVKLVGLDCARARIVGIDTSAALAVPGVRLVMTAADLPQPMPRFGPQFQDRPVLADRGDALPRRARRRGGRRNARRGRGRPLVSSGSSTRRCRPSSPIAGALAPDAPLVQDPALRPGRSAGRHERPARAPLRLGRRRCRGGRGGGRRRGHLRLPDGHPVRHRAARLHGRTGRRRHRHLELDPAPELAAARHRQAARAAAGQGARLRAGPGWWLRWQAARQVRAARRLHGPAHGATGAADPDAGRDLPGGAARGLRGPRAFGLPIGRSARLPGHRGELPHRRVRGHRRSHGWQGLLHRQRPVLGPRSSDLCPQRPLAHHAVHGLPRLRQPAADLGGRVEHGRSGPRPGHRSARAPPAQPRPARRAVHPRRHAGRR